MTQTTGIPEDLDFDHADTTTIEQGILDAGRTVENRYIVKFPNLYVRTYQGATYRLPLAITERYLKAMDKLAEQSPLAQIKAQLLRENPDASKRIDAELTVSLLAIADKWSDVIVDVQRASLGKYAPSGKKSTKSA